jgi:hypothetical protein
MKLAAAAAMVCGQAQGIDEACEGSERELVEQDKSDA